MDGTPFGRYRLLELLGRGGMGEVWRAYDTVTDRVVALKLLPANLVNDQVFHERFRREARAAAGLDEPHVVPIHDFGEIEGLLYVTMRLIRGHDLEALLRGGPLEPARAVGIVQQIASALHAAHRIDLVHRDVKPTNIMVAEDDFAYLIDFGIARATAETGLTSTGTIIGTWAYMAPERFTTGRVDARADIYALTCVLHEALTGHRPYPGDSLEQQIAGHLTTPPPRPSAMRRAVPSPLDAVIATGMAKDPDQRYKTSKDLAQAARAALATSTRRTIPGTSTQTTQTVKAPPPTKKVAAKPPPERAQRSSQPKLTPMLDKLAAGTWAKVVAAGDKHDGLIGKVVAICDDDDDDDGLDVIVEFRGDSNGYAFRRQELTPTAPPAERQATPSAPPGGEDFWLDVGIDPIRIITYAGDFLTLRCYLDDAPIFLGYDGLINVFRSGRALRRYLAGNPDNDMSSLDTYGDITIAAIEGSLRVDEVTENNVYVLRGLAGDIAAGPRQVDRLQLELAVELLSDVGKYVDNTIVEDYLQTGQPLGDLVKSVLVPNYIPNPRRSRGDALSHWTRLEDFLESRLRTK